MSKEKQIEKMAKDLCDSTMCDLETFNDCRMPQGNCSRCQRVAKDLYNAGYRKQSKGEWVTSDIPQEKYVCSVCGGACWYYDYQGDVAKSRYCPNCGAKMRQEDEGK